jgi:hypothetical protein
MRPQGVASLCPGLSHDAPSGLWDRFYVVRDPLKPSTLDRVLGSESNPTVARSSEAVRADDYELRSTVLRGRARIAIKQRTGSEAHATGRQG